MTVIYLRNGSRGGYDSGLILGGSARLGSGNVRRAGRGCFALLWMEELCMKLSISILKIEQEHEEVQVP
jgi:hypothetical protein